MTTQAEIVEVTILGVHTRINTTSTGPWTYKSTCCQNVEWGQDGYPSRAVIVHASTREEYEEQLRAAQALHPDRQP